jgi:hypothetical protein
LPQFLGQLFDGRAARNRDPKVPWWHLTPGAAQRDHVGSTGRSDPSASASGDPISKRLPDRSDAARPAGVRRPVDFGDALIEIEDHHA